MSNLSTRLAGRKMPHKDVPICLDLNLLAGRDEAMRALTQASRAAKPSVDDDRMVSRKDSPAVTAAKERLASLEREILEHSITLRVRGVDRLTYNRWLVECPPRKGKQEPYDPAKFFMHAAKNSAVYIDEQGAENEISPEEWAEIDATLTDGEHDRIAQAVIHVNRSAGGVDVGFFVNASETTRDSFGISASRETSGSPRVASGAGSRKKSTSKKSSTENDESE